MATELIEAAQAGDHEAFEQLISPYQRELEVHCYRILGSAQDAEDALQETLLAAWRGLGGFEGRASVRTWLYQVATNRCLNALRSASRRPQQASWAVPGVEPPEPSRMGEVTWLEPYPDFLLDGLPDDRPGPEARYESFETISLAFITALQLLPPRQRAVLILRDVLGFRAREVAGTLGTTEESVTSLLKRARATLQRRLDENPEPPPAPGSATEQHLLTRLSRAYQTGDVDALVEMLTDNARLAMPPIPLEYIGRDRFAEFMRVVGFRQSRTYELVPTRANGQPAMGMYLRDPHGGPARANGLQVITLAGDRISAITRFENGLLPRFGLPRSLPGGSR
jgi:RNA polymerase sigma-70 factor (ECF subfamily)